MPTTETLFSNPLVFGLLLVAAFLTGLSKGGMPAIGMLSVPILSMLMSPLVAAVLLLPIYILSDVVSVWLYRREYSLENIKILIPAGVVGVVVGWATATLVSDVIVTLCIGVMGITFCLYTWVFKLQNQIPNPVSFKKGVFWGAVSGFTSFVAHAGGPPFQVYVLPQKLPKMVFAGTTTIVFAAINLAKTVPYYNLHPYTLSTMKVCLYLLPMAAIGTVVGKKLIERLSEKWFYLAVQMALFIISVKLVYSAVRAFII